MTRPSRFVAHWPWTVEWQISQVVAGPAKMSPHARQVLTVQVAGKSCVLCGCAELEVEVVGISPPPEYVGLITHRWDCEWVGSLGLLTHRGSCDKGPWVEPLCAVVIGVWWLGLWCDSGNGCESVSGGLFSGLML